MIRKLNGNQIKDYFYKYGDGDIYFSHQHMQNGTIEVTYLPKFLKFVDDRHVQAFIKELNEHPHILSKYAKVIVLTNKFAYIPNDDKSNKNPLVQNYSKFLDELKSANYQMYK